MLLLLAAVGFGVLFLAHTAPLPFILEALAGKDRAVWRMPAGPGPPRVYLTYDDGPNPEATPALLDVLLEERVAATFFLIDRHLTEETAPIVRRMFDEGHAVALHSHTRAHMFMTPEQLAETLAAAADRIERFGGRPPCPAYRPHAGWRSGAMYAGLEKLGYRLVGWGWMMWDWSWYRRPSPEGVATRIVNGASAGEIIVMHDGHHLNPRAERLYTVQATGLLIPRLRDRGFRFGTICG